MGISQNKKVLSTDAYRRVKKLSPMGYLFIRLISSSLVYGQTEGLMDGRSTVRVWELTLL